MPDWMINSTINIYTLEEMWRNLGLWHGYSLSRHVLWISLLDTSLASKLWLFLSFLKILFIFGEGEGGRKRGRDTSLCGCLLNTPYWGPSPQSRHVPWLGIEPATRWFTGQCSVHWATPARNDFFFKTHTHTHTHKPLPWTSLNGSSRTEVLIIPLWEQVP